MDDELDIPNKTYKITNGRIVGFIDDLAAIRQAIEKVLSTDRFAYEIYTENYGHDLGDLIGEQMDLAKAEVERLITEAILVDERILSIENFEIVQETMDSLRVQFDVETIAGSLAMNEGVTI